MFKRIISCALSPNTDSKDVLLACTLLLSPWHWKTGSAKQRVRDWFVDAYHPKALSFFHSGRAALYVLLRSFGIGQGDEVIVQAFTCVAVANSVRWAGATPVYVDIDDTLNIDPQQAESRISPKTKAIIVQHTFGTPADMDRLVALAKKRNLVLIEDCAHAIGSTVSGRPVGTIGDAAFFSFGRDKAISSVWGGAAMILAQCKHKQAAKKLQLLADKHTYPSSFWIVRQIFHPIAFAIILPTYRIGLGKLLLVLLQRANLLSLPVEKKEKLGGKPKHFVYAYPNAMAALLVLQLNKLHTMIDLRKANAMRYQHAFSSRMQFASCRDGSSYLRAAAFTDTRDELCMNVRTHGVLLGLWYHHVIDPKDVRFDTIGYVTGSCPRAEKKAARVVNLPTQITHKECSRVISVLEACL